MNQRKFLSQFLILFIVGIATIFNTPTLFAQSSGQGNNQSGSGLNLNFDIFGGTYLPDPLGIQMANNQFPYDGVLDMESYVLGVNDLLSIKIEASQTLFIRGVIVNPQGDVTLPSIGPVKLDGLTLLEAEQKIKESSKSVVNNAEVQITLESPRPVYLQITGGVPHPGKYLIPAMSRVDQAIYQSITSGSRELSRSLSNSSDFLTTGNFSFRNITITRANGEKLTADLVSYFRLGNSSSNPVVKDGDLINIKRLNREAPKVSISGAVKADYEFEFVKGDTPARLLEIGGGFEEVADESKLYVYRRTDSGTEQLVIAPQEWETFELEPNDRVVAPFNREKDASASAWVYGEVQVPGNFPIVGGETTALQLLNLTGGLTGNALPTAAYLMRGGGLLNEIPNKFNADLMRRTSDQVLQGLEYLEAETELSKNKVFIDLKDEEQLAGLEIFDGDRLYIPKDEQTVFVFGQVNNPGYFPYSNPRTAFDYVSKAGGFALSANKDRVFIIKAGNATWYRPGEAELESGDRIFVDRQPVEELNALRSYEIQKAQLRNQRTQLIMTAITTITGIITTYVAIQNIRN
ncbi:MAG: SLBB domain-containing protein [Balneolaceae bacterium]